MTPKKPNSNVRRHTEIIAHGRSDRKYGQTGPRSDPVTTHMTEFGWDGLNAAFFQGAYGYGYEVGEIVRRSLLRTLRFGGRLTEVGQNAHIDAVKWIVTAGDELEAERRKTYRLSRCRCDCGYRPSLR
jgi:hypothetical protein